MCILAPLNQNWSKGGKEGKGGVGRRGGEERGGEEDTSIHHAIPPGKHILNSDSISSPPTAKGVFKVPKKFDVYIDLKGIGDLYKTEVW